MHNYSQDEVDDLTSQLEHCEKRYNILLEMFGEMSKLLPNKIDISELDKNLRKIEEVKETTVTKVLTAKEVAVETSKFLRGAERK